MAKYSFEQKPGESIERYYRRIAKVADQRLVRLEQLAGQEGYGNATQWAYRRAMSDIETWSGPDAKRFNTKPPESLSAMRAKINDIKTFLGSESSTKSGITRTYVNRANTINKRYGTNFQPDDLAKFFTSCLSKKLEKEFEKASKTMMKAIGYISEHATDDDMLKAMQKEARKRKEVPTFTGDTFLDGKIAMILRSETSIKNMYDYLKS